MPHFFACLLLVLFFLFGLTSLAHISMELNDITDCGMLPRFNVIDIDILATACLIICLLQLILLRDILLRFFRRLDWYTSCSSPRLVWEKSSEKGHILKVYAHMCGSVYHQIHVHTPSFITECTLCYYSNYCFERKVAFLSRGKIILVLSSSFWDLGQHSLP